jgi:hypothetical protein
VLPWVFFYEDTLNATLLKSSLAQVLNTFPLAAGRVVPAPQPRRWWQRLCGSQASGSTPQWHLICSNAGMPFTTTSTAASSMEGVLKGDGLARRGFRFPADPSTTATEHAEVSQDHVTLCPVLHGTPEARLCRAKGVLHPCLSCACRHPVSCVVLVHVCPCEHAAFAALA